MCYLIAKKFGESGCIALDVTERDDLGRFVASLDLAYLEKGIQFVVLGNPEIYREYKPYKFADHEISFLEGVKELCDYA